MQDRVLCSNCFVPSMAPPEPISYIREPKHLVLCKNVRTSKKACRSSSVWDLAGVLTDPCLVKQGLYSCGTATESHRSFPVSFSGWPLRNQNSNRSSVSPNENRFQFCISGLVLETSPSFEQWWEPIQSTTEKVSRLENRLVLKTLRCRRPQSNLTPHSNDLSCRSTHLRIKKTQSQEDSWATPSQ